MKKFGKKKILLGLVVGVFIVFVAWMGVDYFRWNETKNVIADGGYPSLYAGTLGAVTPCTYSSAGCSCSGCEECCNTFSEAKITIGQPVNNGLPNICVSESIMIKGTPLNAASGKQFMAGSLTPKCLSGNAVMATASLAVSNIDKFKKFVGEFFIALVK